jgi:ADP-ribose diphosphatase
MRRKPVVTRTETIARTRLFHVEQVGLRFANGREVSWERMRSAPGGWWCRCSTPRRCC